MNLQEAIKHLNQGEKVTRSLWRVNKNINYVILGMSDGNTTLEASTNQICGSTTYPLIVRYQMWWDDIIATDWEVV